MEYKVLNFKESAVDIEERTFTGYASIFGNIDHGNDIVQQGAFKKTIKERGDKVKVMYNHSWNIGKAKHLEETKKGLWVEGYISRTQQGDDVLTLMNDGAIDEMSFAYDVVKQDMEDIDGQEIRILKELILYEISPVDFAMNELAEITAVKAIAEKRGIKLDNDQVKQIINSIQSIEPPNEALNTEPNVSLDEDVLKVLARIEKNTNLSMVRRKINVR